MFLRTRNSRDCSSWTRNHPNIAGTCIDLIVARRADIYALGLILNEMFTSEIPQGTSYMTIASVAPEFAYLDRVV